MRRRKRRRRASPGPIILLLPIIIGIIIAVIISRMEPPKKPETAVKGISNVLSVKKDGHLINTLTDSRTEDYGEESSHEAYIREIVDEYNKSSGRDEILIKSSKVDKDGLTIVIEYPDHNSFSELNGYTVFTGTVEDAQKAGYDMDTMLVSTGKKEEEIRLGDIDSPGKKHIIITSVLAGESLIVETFSKIKYCSDAMLLDKKSAVPHEDSQSYIVW